VIAANGALQLAAIQDVSSCPACGGKRLRERFEVAHYEGDPLYRWAENVGYRRAPIVECGDCAFVFKGKQPSEEFLRRHYSQTSAEYQERQAEDDAAYRTDYELARRLLAQRYPQGGHILDVGCGRGFFLRSLGRRWERHGVEPSQSAAEFAARENGIPVHAGSLLAMKFPAEFFDVVTLFDVLEHLAEPARIVAEVRRLLKPGSSLLIGTGNVGSFAARLAGRQWAYLAIPDHVSFFSKASLRNTLVKAGFSEVVFHTLHHGQMSFGVASGWLRAVLRHRLIEMFGMEITRLPVFRHKDATLPVPYFRDHFICVAR
jgi:2-polyprenyl-3-methyl-5-hydroxy-6-metoxy-1,4-benzoquinol methylase